MFVLSKGNSDEKAHSFATNGSARSSAAEIPAVFPFWLCNCYRTRDAGSPSKVKVVTISWEAPCE